ncbi:MAG: UDP-N-acetylmuramoyl-tripeptide--D-alanyl-D-alanine ligase, partial [Desulfobacteraceae bacterium]
MTAIRRNITLKEFIDPVNGALLSGGQESVITGISTDTREIKKGEIFIALRGENFDGHNFIPAAVLKGAACIVVDDETRLPENPNAAVIKVKDCLTALGDFACYWRHQHEVKVVSITGSMGKTTTKEMTACILEMENGTLKNEGNFNNLIGLPFTLLGLKKVHKRAVLEMGMNHFDEIRRLTQISDPDIGVITNVGPVHLEGVNDIKGVARAKTEMIEEIRPESRVILSGDDNILMKEASRFNRDFFTFGLGPDNDVYADSIETLKSGGMTYRLRYRNESAPVELQVSGMHNLINSLAAASAAICMEDKFENIAEGLIRFKGVKGRLITDVLPDDILLLDDTYNSNPSSLKAALDVAKEMAGGERRIIVGLGEMLELGDETVRAHIQAGKLVAETGAEFLFAIGANAQQMLKGAVEKGFPSERAIESKSQHDMIDQVNDVVEKGDLVLLK